MRSIAGLVALLGASLTLGAEPTVNFDMDIVPVLTKSGCNTGACHGAAAGRGGFRLSLYGGDPAFDHESIARELEGRRVNQSRPGESLVILKPISAIKHGGGMRLSAKGEALLTSWIAGGARREGGTRLEGVTVTPADPTLADLGREVRFRVTARFADGVARDVTEWTVFKADDPAAVRIGNDGASATVLRRGRHTIIARYLDRVVPVRLTVPMAGQQVEPVGVSSTGFIDDHVARSLAELRIPASGPAEDSSLIRRLTLDLTGRLHDPADATAYREDSRPDKHVRLADRLLASRGYAEFWTYRLAKLLRIRSQPKETAGALAYHRWLLDRVEAGTPYDEMARTLLTAEGDSHVVGPANFSRTVGGPREQAEFVSELFMGSRLRCANCHNHPLDRWTQDDYHGLAAIFAPVQRGRVVTTAGEGEVIHPRTGEPARPRIPGVRFLNAEGAGTPAFADWLTSPENPFFARAIVNRLWAGMMGRGLIESTDDLRDTNPATHPELLTDLARDFVRHGYDLRHSLRRIALSETYARSALSLPQNRSDQRYYSHALVRPLEPEVLADAISDVTGVPGEYGDHPSGTRAVNLFDPSTPSRDLDVLGRCSRQDTCEGMAVESGGLPRALHLSNGELLNRRLTAKLGRLARMIRDDRPPTEIVSEFYLLALGRNPSPEERRYWEGQFDGVEPDSQEDVLADFLWALLNSREFLTNH